MQLVSERLLTPSRPAPARPDRLLTPLLSIAFNPAVRGTTLLTVAGRKSGRPRTTPVTVITDPDGHRWLIAPFGEVNWVRNLRAAGTATLRSGRRSETIRAIGLTPA